MARSDARLKTLPEEIQAEMWRLRIAPVDDEGNPAQPADGAAWSQERVRQWLEDVHSVSTSSGAFSEWERWYGVASRLRGAKDYADDIKSLLKSRDPKMEVEQLDAYGDLAFRKRALDLDDAELFAEMRKIGQRDRHLDQQKEKLSQNDRRIILNEKKAARYDAVKDAAESTDDLTPEERLEKIREGLKI